MEKILKRLETSMPASSAVAVDTPVEIGVSSNRELGLTMTFGELDTDPSSLERFLTHYELVDNINQERGLRHGINRPTVH